MEVIVDLGGLMVLALIAVLWVVVIGFMLCQQAEIYDAEYEERRDEID